MELEGMRVETEFDPATVRWSSSGSAASNTERSPVMRALRGGDQDEEIPLDLYVFDGDELVAGLTGDTWASWLAIELSGSTPTGGGRASGASSSREAERLARERGCIGVRLDTWDFQARPFYEQHGYTVFGVLEDYPPGATEYHMAKRLDGWDRLRSVAREAEPVGIACAASGWHELHVPHGRADGPTWSGRTDARAVVRRLSRRTGRRWSAMASAATGRRGSRARRAPPGWPFAGWRGSSGGTIGRLPGSGHQRPAVERVEVVVGVADPVELVEAGVPGVLVLGAGAVVVLDDRAAAPLDRAGRRRPQQGVAHGLRGAPGERGDVGDRVALGDDQLEHGVAEQAPGRLDRDRPEARDLAQLVALDVAAPERLDVEPQEGEVLRPGGFLVGLPGPAVAGAGSSAASDRLAIAMAASNASASRHSTGWPGGLVADDLASGAGRSPPRSPTPRRPGRPG